MVEFNNNKLLKGSYALFAGSVIARASMLLFRYIAALNLTPSDYGRLSLYISLFLTLSIIASSGIGGSLAKLAVKNTETGKDPYRLFANCILLISFTNLLAIIIFLIVLKQILPELLIFQIATASAIGFLFWSYCQISIGFSIAEFKFTLASFYEAGDGIVKLLLLIIAYLFLIKVNLKACIMSFTLAYLFLSIFAAINNYKFFGISSCINFLKSLDFLLLKKIVSHSSPLMFITFFNLFYGLMLRSFLVTHSNVEVAIFDMAFTFYSVPRMVLIALVRPVVPYAARQNDHRIIIPQIGKFFIFMTISLFILIVLEVTGIVEFTLKVIGLSDYIRSFPIFLIFMSGSFFDIVFGFLSSYIQGLGRINIVCFTTLFTTIFTLPISFYGVKFFKAYGAAVSYVIFMAILSGLSVFLAYRIFGFRHNYNKGIFLSWVDGLFK